MNSAQATCTVTSGQEVELYSPNCIHMLKKIIIHYSILYRGALYQGSPVYSDIWFVMCFVKMWRAVALRKMAVIGAECN